MKEKSKFARCFDAERGHVEKMKIISDELIAKLQSFTADKVADDTPMDEILTRAMIVCISELRGTRDAIEKIESLVNVIANAQRKQNPYD